MAKLLKESVLVKVLVFDASDSSLLLHQARDMTKGLEVMSLVVHDATAAA